MKWMKMLALVLVVGGMSLLVGCKSDSSMNTEGSMVTITNEHGADLYTEH